MNPNETASKIMMARMSVNMSLTVNLSESVMSIRVGLSMSFSSSINRHENVSVCVWVY